MTREEAIDYLTELWGSDSTSVDETIALEMAIEALKAEPFEDAISREEMLQTIDRRIGKVNDTDDDDDI